MKHFYSDIKQKSRINMDNKQLQELFDKHTEYKLSKDNDVILQNFINSDVSDEKYICRSIMILSILAFITGIYYFSCHVNKHHIPITDNETVCRSVNYQKDINPNNGSLIPNTPTPTLTGECGSKYAFNNDNLSFDSHVENTNITNKKGRVKVANLMLTAQKNDFTKSPDPIITNNFLDAKYQYTDFELFENFGYLLKDTFALKIKSDTLNKIKNKQFVSFNTSEELEQIPTLIIMGPNNDQRLDDDKYYIEEHLVNKETLEEHIVKQTIDKKTLINTFSKIVYYLDIQHNEQYNYFSNNSDFAVNRTRIDEDKNVIFLETNDKSDFLKYVKNFKEADRNIVQVNNISKIIASPLGRFNAWKVMKNVPNNYSGDSNDNYWYKINKEGKISQFLLDQSTQPIISINIVKEDDKHKIAHIIWLQRIDNDINGIINIHDALIVMPNKDYKAIEQNIKHKNYINHEIKIGDEQEMDNWNQLNDSEIKDMTNKMFLNNSLEKITD